MKKSLNYKVSYDFKNPDNNQIILDKLYSYHEDISTRIFHRMRINAIYEELVYLLKTKSLDGKKLKALDIGCNCGYLSKMISEFDISYVLGIDIFEESIKLAKANFSHECLEFRTEDATKMNIAEKFDLILCTEVIEHTNNPNEVIKSIHSLLKDNGVAIISLPNKLSFNFLITILGKKILRRPFSEYLRQHTDYPFYKTLRIFKKEGFKILKSRGVNMFLIDNLLPFIYKRKFIIRFDSFFSRLYPFKYFSQFFFITITKRND